MSCSHSCLRNAWCTSTNFREPSEKNGKGSCELNKHGGIDGNINFHDEQGVTFSMLLKVKLTSQLVSSKTLIFIFFHLSNINVEKFLIIMLCLVHKHSKNVSFHL